MPTYPWRLDAAYAWATTQELSENQGRAGSERENSHGSDQKDFARIEASGKSQIARLQRRPAHDDGGSQQISQGRDRQVRALYAPRPWLESAVIRGRPSFDHVMEDGKLKFKVASIYHTVATCRDLLMLASRVINEHPIRLATPAIRRSNGSVSVGSKRACSMSSQISGSMINDPVSSTRVFHSAKDRVERSLLLSNSKSNSKKHTVGI